MDAEGLTPSAIETILRHYFPDWQPPDDRHTWNPCLCPAHDEDRPSCSVSYEHDAVKCQACGFRGNVVSIVQRQEGVAYAEAIRRAKEILGGSDVALPPSARRKPGRRTFGSARTDRVSRPVPPWLRP